MRHHLFSARRSAFFGAAFFLAAGFWFSPACNYAQDSASSAQTATLKDAAPGRISLDLKGIDIVELFKILSLKMNVNIVPTKDVTGRVNIFLNNVTLEDALDIILINNSLAAVKEKNIITIMPLEQYVQLYGRQRIKIGRAHV